MNDSSFNPSIGSVTSVDQFPYDGPADRIIMPVENVDFLTTEHKIHWDAFSSVPRITPDPFIMATFDRTPEGWKRIK